MSSANYLKKINANTNLDEELRAMLVQSHENLGCRSTYFMQMENPRLDVSTSWHMTITAALDRAKMLTGNFKIYLNQRILTLQECEAIIQCEEGELDPHRGCSIAKAKEIRELREKEERFETRDDEDDEYDELYALLEGDEDDQEMLEMWLEKMDRPGRKLARGSDESALDILLRMKETRQNQKMSAIEF